MKKPVRILGRLTAHTMTQEEIQAVSGAVWLGTGHRVTATSMDPESPGTTEFDETDTDQIWDR